MDRGERLAAIALAHAGCSEILHQDVYIDVVVRPVDRTPEHQAYYTENLQLSTCALTAVGLLRLAGCVEPECTETYLPTGRPMRNAFVDVQTLARRCGAWVTSSPPVPTFKRGDIWIIVDPATGGDGHMGTCTSDAILNTDGSWTVNTVEGGQLPVDASGHAQRGSSAIMAFTRHFVRSGAHMMLGARCLLGYASAGSMPVPDDVDASSDRAAGG